jgi:hypothetical protein
VQRELISAVVSWASASVLRAASLPHWPAAGILPRWWRERLAHRLRPDLGADLLQGANALRHEIAIAVDDIVGAVTSARESEPAHSVSRGHRPGWPAGRLIGEQGPIACGGAGIPARAPVPLDRPGERSVPRLRARSRRAARLRRTRCRLQHAVADDSPMPELRTRGSEGLALGSVQERAAVSFDALEHGDQGRCQLEVGHHCLLSNLSSRYDAASISGQKTV